MVFLKERFDSEVAEHACLFVLTTYFSFIQKRDEQRLCGSSAFLPPGRLSYCSFSLTRGTLAACCLLDVLQKIVL